MSFPEIALPMKTIFRNAGFAQITNNENTLTEIIALFDNLLFPALILRALHTLDARAERVTPIGDKRFFVIAVIAFAARAPNTRGERWRFGPFRMQKLD